MAEQTGEGGSHDGRWTTDDGHSRTTDDNDDNNDMTQQSNYADVGVRRVREAPTTQRRGGAIPPQGHGCAKTTGEDTGGEEGEAEHGGNARASGGSFCQTDPTTRRSRMTDDGETTIKQCRGKG